MSLLAGLAKMAFDDCVAEQNSEADPMRALTTRYAFLPAPETIIIPSGWFGVLTMAARRLSATVPMEEWGRSFRVSSFGVRHGGLDIGVVGGTLAAHRVLKKMHRASTSICSECGTPGLVFAGTFGPRPHCPKCLEIPALIRDLEDLLAWRAGLEGPAGMGIRPHRIPPTLRASFQLWHEASGIDLAALQPWNLEGWLRDLSRAQKTLRRAHSIR